MARGTSRCEDYRMRLSRATYNDILPRLRGLTRVHLLKEIEKLTGQAFLARLGTDELGRPRVSDLRIQAERVIFKSDLAGIQEGSQKWFELMKAKQARMSLTRDCILFALEGEFEEKCGFNAFDRALICGSTRISQAYDEYWNVWMQACIHSDVKDAIDMVDEKEHPPFLKSPYTMIRISKDTFGKTVLTVEPYAIFLNDVLKPVLVAFDNCINEISSLNRRDPNVAFMIAYRDALAETEIEKLDSAWERVDRRWMDCDGPIQVVHDIEEGYFDPLRCKQGPDFSIRFVDETYSKQNDEIKMIHRRICEFYEARGSFLAKRGLQALSKTNAWLVYSPFNTGCSLAFTYSGQSVPNRLNVKKEKGVKIYFNPVETDARLVQTIKKVKLLFHEADKLLNLVNPNGTDQIVWHVAAHEVGHAIYQLKNMEAFVGPGVCTLLEEPRAELTAMFTLWDLLFKKDVINFSMLTRHVLLFMMDGVRYFGKWGSAPMEPYIIFYVYSYNVYEEYGLLKVNRNKKIVVDESKVAVCCEQFSMLFRQMLNTIDQQNEKGGNELVEIMEMMQKPGSLVRHMVKELTGVNL